MDPTQVMALSSDLLLRSRYLVEDHKIQRALASFREHEISFEQFSQVVTENLPRFGDLGYSSYLESAGLSLQGRKQYSDLRLSKSAVAIDIGFGAIIAAIIAYCAARDCSNTYWKATTRTLWFLKRMARFVREYNITAIIKEEQIEIRRQIARSESIRDKIQSIKVGESAKRKRLEHWDDRIILLTEQLKAVTDKSKEAKEIQKKEKDPWARLVRLMGLF